MTENGLDSKPPTHSNVDHDPCDIPLDFSVKRGGGGDHVTPPTTSSQASVTSHPVVQATPAPSPAAMFADRAALASALSAAGLVLRAPTSGAMLVPGQALPSPLADATDKVRTALASVVLRFCQPRRGQLHIYDNGCSKCLKRCP